VRIAIDATPAIVQRGGVGRYTRELLRAIVLETLDHKFILSAASNQSEIDDLLTDIPPGAWREVRKLPAPERIMTAFWQRFRLPFDIARWIGPHDLYHGTDFVLPPTKARKVVTIHDLSFMLHPEYCHPELARYLQSAVPRSLERADVVITVSSSVAAEVATMFPGVRSKIVAIPNGVVPPRESIQDRIGQEPVALMVGTIEPRKNYETALAAMRQVRAQRPYTRLVIVGRRGWLDDEIVQQIERAKADGWLTWMDSASDSDLEDAYRRASIFVATSHYEGFGLPVLEAMARGLPCVVSNIAAHREVAGGAAVYVGAANTEEFADSITSLLDDESSRRQRSEEGLEQANKFSWRETARRTLRVYERSASGSSQ
jgi:glycosyltransferase involved in cell wall biosynthesis